MGKRNTRRKNAAMLDSEDDNSSVSSTSTMRSDYMSVSGTEEVQLEKDSLLDEALDALYEKRGSTREKALASIIEAFNNSLQHQFVEKKFATLLHQCLGSIKRGSSREIALASQAIGLLALTVGFGDNAREILDESVTPISQALKAGSESLKTVALLECLAIITFVGGNDLEETERSMEIMWQLVHPKLGSNVVSVKPSATVITAMVSAWSFLLATLDDRKLDPKHWQQSISYFSSLLDKNDRSVRIAAGEALALIFEIGSLEKFSAEANGSNGGSQEGYTHVQGLKGKILNQVRNLSIEAGGKGSAKKDLNNQRNLFKDILEFLEDGYCPETSMKIGGESLKTSTWSQMIQLNFLKHFLGGGFIKHMQENEFLHDVLGFTPKRKYLPSNEHGISSSEKRMYRSPNSVVNKARTQLLNKQRMLSEGRNVGHYAITLGNEEI
ncbi:interferon-related developmental regulator 1-like [Mangifera indica]|uniref:interferon-related developmental regulator 1-like n=1 Tax=Mangifera indica TaxID=29780 RepID=UPI001CF9F1BC|nr:interferon-related developmental regulator 1-like [Mangifera indica]